MMTLARRINASLLTLTLLGCRQDAGLSYEDFQAAQVATFCDYLVRCGVATAVELCLASPLPPLWARYALTGYPRELDALLADGGVVYHPDRAEACLQRIADAACTFSDLFAIGSDLGPRCGDAFSGSVAEGGACWVHQQCVSARCEINFCDQACCAGVCAPPVQELALGEPCEFGEWPDPCVAGTRCGPDRRCIAGKSSGETCDPERRGDCLETLMCASNGDSTGTCREYPALGERCVNGTCDLGLVCEGATVTCIKVSGEGEACEYGRPYACALGLDCDPDSRSCVRLEAGKPCAYTQLGEDCPEGTFCLSFICEPQKANGDLCGQDFACASEYCDPGTHLCAEPRACAR